MSITNSTVKKYILKHTLRPKNKLFKFSLGLAKDFFHKSTII